jgi:hypothetical protein
MRFHASEFASDDMITGLTEKWKTRKWLRKEMNGSNIRFSWEKIKAEINASDYSSRNDSAATSDAGSGQVVTT